MNPFSGWNITFAQPWMLCLLLAIPVLAWLRGRQYSHSDRGSRSRQRLRTSR